MAEIGSIVIVESGLMHIAGRVLEPAGENRLWLDCNIMGNHLPQMYRTGELTDASPEAAAHGMCPQCLGFGLVEEGQCPGCEGSGRSGVKVDITDIASGKETHLQWDPTLVDQISCDLCRKAFIPT